MLFLVVDDDALSRDLLTLLLEAEGHSVQVADSGEACLARIAASPSGASAMPQVVLADLRMPGLSASPLAAALRPMLPPRALIVAISGSSPDPSAISGFDGFLLKPFQVSELEALIRDAADAQPEASRTPRAERSRDEAPAENGCAIGADAGPVLEALDTDIYEKMCELMPAEQLGQMYALCVGDARKRIDTMSAFAASGDDPRYRSEAHTVKGGCGMMGAKELHELAAAAERNGLRDTSGTTAVTATLQQLSAACDRLERILELRAKERLQEGTPE